jgi:hypothetical protein
VQRGACVAGVALLAVIAAGCSDGSGSAGTATGTTLAATSGNLRVTVSVTPTSTPPGAPVRFVIHATAANAPGLLSYQVEYGDGHSDQNVVAQVCRGGANPTQRETWRLTHRYERAGTFDAIVTVNAGCTPDRTDSEVSIRVR